MNDSLFIAAFDIQTFNFHFDLLNRTQYFFETLAPFATLQMLIRAIHRKLIIMLNY